MPRTYADALAACHQAAAAPVLVQTSEALHSAAAAWHKAPVIGLDTEFFRERTYCAQPGLVQISDGLTVWLVDPLALCDFGALRAMLERRDCLKILHSAGEDLEVLQQLTGVLPQPMHDTQIAAALTGRPAQMAYERLVEDALGQNLPGGKARSDWLQRPLPADLLQYAAHDVAFLPALDQVLSEELRSLDRLQWLQQDCSSVLDHASRQPDPDLAWTRVRGASRLETDDQCYRLMALATWREQQAIAHNRPRRFIIKDDPLLEIARRAPDKAAALRDIRELPERVARRHEQDLLRLAGLKAPPDFVRPCVFAKLSAQQREQLRNLQLRIKKTAERLGIEPPVIASKRDLVEWLRNETPPWLHGWRGELLNATG